MSHSDLIKDADAFFEVDAVTRQIINKTPAKIVLMQKDHNSEKFTFKLPRYIEGHDMAQTARAQVHYINVDSATGAVSKDKHIFYDLAIDPDDESSVLCSWLISGNATKYSGRLTFILEFDCFEDDELVYSWHSASYSGITIDETFTCDESQYVQYADIIEQWEKMLFDANEDGVTNITEAKADALNSIASAKAEAVEEIESKTSYSVDDDGNASFYKDVRSTDNASIVHSLNDAANGIINKSEGTSLYLPDSAESALVDLSIDGEYSKICVCGNNLFNPIGISAKSTENKENFNATKIETGTTYNSDIGIKAIVTDTSNISNGSIYMRFEAPFLKLNHGYTIIADVTVDKNHRTDTEHETYNQIWFRSPSGGANAGTLRVKVPENGGRVAAYIPDDFMTPNPSYPNSLWIQCSMWGKDITLKNIMLVEGDCRGLDIDYEDYKGQEITNVDNYKSIHTYYPITRIINDTDANMSVKYVADTKNYIDNKVADTKKYIDNKVAELQKTMNATT